MMQDDSSLAPLPASIGFALRRAQAAVGDDFAARFNGEAIRPGQFAALQLIKQAPGVRQSQVSAALGIKRTNLVPLLDELEQRGLAQRRPVPDDRRAAALYLTDAGHATLARLDALAQAHEARFAARLGPNEHAALLGLLARLADPAFDTA